MTWWLLAWGGASLGLLLLVLPLSRHPQKEVEYEVGRGRGAIAAYLRVWGSIVGMPVLAPPIIAVLAVGIPLAGQVVAAILVIWFILRRGRW